MTVVPGEFPTQRSVTQSFDVFFDLRLNKRLSKQWWSWWFETLSCPLWRHRTEFYIFNLPVLYPHYLMLACLQNRSVAFSWEPFHWHYSRYQFENVFEKYSFNIVINPQGDQCVNSLWASAYFSRGDKRLIILRSLNECPTRIMTKGKEGYPR